MIDDNDRTTLPSPTEIQPLKFEVDTAGLLRTISDNVMHTVLASHELGDEDRRNLERAVNEVARNMCTMVLRVSLVSDTPSLVTDTVTVVNCLMTLHYRIAMLNEADIEMLVELEATTQYLLEGLRLARSKRVVSWCL